MSVNIRNVEITTTEQRHVLICDGPECGHEALLDFHAVNLNMPTTWYTLRLPKGSPSADDPWGLSFCGLDCLKNWTALAMVDAIYAGKAE